MEVHAPDHPIITFKEALIHLSIVTIGILIALSLEGALEAWHHRELVHETREHLQAETRSNHNSIQTVLKSLEPRLNTASYKTAVSTGALGLMEYSEAFKYSDIYDLQEVYVRMQDSAEKDMFAAFALGTGMLLKPAPAEIADIRRQLRLALSGLLPMENLVGKAVAEVERRFVTAARRDGLSASARVANDSLLFTGDDFARTDISPA